MTASCADYWYHKEVSNATNAELMDSDNTLFFTDSCPERFHGLKGQSLGLDEVVEDQDTSPEWNSEISEEEGYESRVCYNDVVLCQTSSDLEPSLWGPGDAGEVEILIDSVPGGIEVTKEVHGNNNVGILDSNGEIKGFGEQTGSKHIQLVAVPIAQSPNKMSPHLLPKPSLTSQIMSSPVRPQVIQVDATSPWSARKRASDFLDSDYGDGKRGKKGDKGGKGLRHFSMKVCEKVQMKGVTSYNEVADELVGEFSEPQNLMSPSDAVTPYDQKNIRRRVYDALNVLMAMNIISKEKKEIRWIGLPTNSAQECQHLEIEKQKRIDRIKQKTQQLQELILQQIAFKNLVQRNRDLERTQGPPAPNSAIQLPFIIVNTSKKTVIDCSISNDKYEYLFKFDNTFEIHDDIEVLKRMGMAFGLERGQCTHQDLARASKMVPKSLEPYVLDMANNSTPFQSSAVRPIDPSSVTAQQARYQQQSTSSLFYGSPDCSDREVIAALSRQSSSGSFDQNSRAATDTPSIYSDEEDTDSDRSSPADLG